MEADGVTNCGFRKLVRYNLNRRVLNMIIWYRCFANQRIFFCRMKFESHTIEIKMVK